MLDQTVGYAITALGYVAAQEGKPVFVREISEATGTPRAYLAKIINTLSRKGYVETRRGVAGGVRLNRPAEELTLYEVCEALDDPIVSRPCMLGVAECSDERACPCHEFWIPHREKEIEFLKRTTVRNIADFEVRELHLDTSNGSERRLGNGENDNE